MSEVQNVIVGYLWYYAKNAKQYDGIYMRLMPKTKAQSNAGALLLTKHYLQYFNIFCFPPVF